MKILITEEALQGGSGHWPSYIGDIASGLRDLGDTVDVVVHRNATDDVLSRVGGIPWFSKNCWVDSSSQRALGGILHNLNFHRELASWIVSHGSYDWICALTMRLQHLLAFALLSRSGLVPKSTRFFLLFVQGFGRYLGHGPPTEFPINGSTILARLCFHLMAPAVRSGRVVLAAETKGMQDEIQRFTGLPVTLAPHPVRFPKRQKAKGERQKNEEKSDSIFMPKGSGLNSPPSASPSVSLVHSVANSSDPLAFSPTHSSFPLTITCPGFARHEKGTDLLQDAILAILAGPDADSFHFVLQWPEPFAMPDGTIPGPDPRLINDPRVEFLNRTLSSDEYEELMERTDVVFLPYRRSSYHNRVSRVAIEAAGRGIPLIYMDGTWSGEVAAMADCGVSISDETPSAVIEAIRCSVGSIQDLKQNALKGGASVRNFHSVEQLRRILTP